MRAIPGYISKSIRSVLVILPLVVMLMAIISCEKQYADDYGDETTNSFRGTEDQSDYTWSDSDIREIELKGSSASSSADGVTISGSVVRITSAGTYRISGTLDDGQIIVSSADENIIRIILNGVSISSSVSAPLYIKSACKVMIVTADGTLNSISDNSSYSSSDDEPTAPVFSKSYLSFYGTGTLSVTGNYKDAIVSKDGLVIKNGIIKVKAVDDGIRGKDFVVIRDGSVSVECRGDAIKSDYETDSDRGYIDIESGNITIKSTGGDGISAQNVISVKGGVINLTTGGGAAANTSNSGAGGFPGQQGTSSNAQTISKKAFKASKSITIEKGTITIDSYDDAFNTEGAITFNGGSVTLSSGDDGIHADASVTINGDEINIIKSYEGIESAQITVNNGILNINSTDDGFNATKGQATESSDGSILQITGGTVTVSTTTGDSMDSNGNATITGGTIIIQGPKSSPEVGFDINGTFNVNGGFIIGSGPNAGMMIEGPSASSLQYAVMVTVSATVSTSSLFHIQNSSGQDLVTFKPARTQYYFVFSSSLLKNDETYSIYTGGSHTGSSVNGYYKDGSYSGGTLKKTFTLSSRITKLSM